jgi:hypothetical protein
MVTGVGHRRWPPRDGATARPDVRRGTPVACLVLALAAAVVFLAFEARRLYFFGDDWDFLIYRDLGWDSLMRPHNEHWSALPVAAYRLMFAVLGIDHYLAYALMPILLHVICCGLLYALMRRNALPAWPAVILVVPFAFLVGKTGENPLWDFQIGFLGSAALGLTALLLHSGDSRRRLALGWGASVLSLACSGMALPLLLWLAIFVLLRSGVRRAALAVLPPGVVYLCWYAGYGREAAAQAPRATPAEVVAFAANGLAHLWERVLLLPFSGVVVLVALAAVSLVAPLARPQRDLALSGVVGVVAMFVLIGVSRGALGADAALASRYSWFGLLLSLPAAVAALALLADQLGRVPRLQPVVGLVLVVLFTALGISQTLHFTDRRTRLTEPAERLIPAAQRLIDEDATLLGEDVAPPYNAGLTVDALRRPDVRSALPDVPTGGRQLLDASATLQVAAAATSFGLPSASDATTRGQVGALTGPGCVELDPSGAASLDLRPTSTGSQVALTSKAGEYRVRLVSGDSHSHPRALTVTPGEQTFIATTSTRGVLRVTLPPDGVRVCL